MTSPVSPAGTTSWQRGSQEACSTAPAKGGKIPTVFQKKAEGCDVAHQLSAQRGDQHPKTDSTQYPLTKRWSEIVQPHQAPELEKQCLSPTEQIVARLKHEYIDSETFRIFDNHFYESFPDSLKAIYLDCKDDLQKCIKIDEDEEASEADLALLPKLLPPRITAITTEIIRLSKGIGSEIPVWLVPTVLILDELKTLLPGSERIKYARPLYQLTFAIRFDDEIPADKRRALLIYMQAHGEELDFHANENLMFEHLITSLQDKDQPALETALTAELEAVHIHESPLENLPLTSVTQETISAAPGKIAPPPPENPSKPVKEQTPAAHLVTRHFKNATASPEDTVESSREQVPPAQDSASSHKKRRKKKRKPQEDKQSVVLREKKKPDVAQAAPVKPTSKVPEVQHGTFVNDLRTGNISNAIEQLNAGNINKPIADNGLPPAFYLLDRDVPIETDHFEELVRRGCNLHQSATVTINETTLNTSPVLFAMHRLGELSKRMVSATELEKMILEKQTETLEQNIMKLLYVDRAGIDQPGQCIRGGIFQDNTPKVITLTPLQFAVTRQLVIPLNTLRTFGAVSNTPLMAGEHQYYPVHVASMTISDVTPLIFQKLLALPQISPINETDMAHTDLTVVTRDGSTPLHVLAETMVMRLKAQETQYAKGAKDGQIEIRGLYQKLNMNLLKVTMTLREHGLDFGRKNNRQQTAEQYFKDLVEKSISSKLLKDDMLNWSVPCFSELIAEPTPPESLSEPKPEHSEDSESIAATSSLHMTDVSNDAVEPYRERTPSTQEDSAPLQNKNRKEKQKIPQFDMDASVSTLPPAHPTIVYTRPVITLSGDSKAPLVTPQEQPSSTQNAELSGKKKRKKQQQIHQPKKDQDEIDAALRALPPVNTTVVSTQPVLNPPGESHGDFLRYLSVGWTDKAMRHLTRENINKPVMYEGLPPLFLIFNHKASLMPRHFKSMVNKSCDLNPVCPLIIDGETVKTSILLYSIHRCDVLASETLSSEEMEKKTKAMDANLKYVVEAGADINMPAEFIRDNIFREYTAQKVMMLTPLQLAVTKQKLPFARDFLAMKANPDIPLNVGDLTCSLAHIACMKIESDTPDLLKLLYEHSEFKTNPNKVTSDGSTVLHCLAKTAVMKVKALETTHAEQDKKQVHGLQRSVITTLEQQALKQLSETIQEHGKDFGIKDNNNQTALEVFRTLVEQEISEEQVKQDMQRLEVFFTQPAVEPAQPVAPPLYSQAGSKKLRIR
ncbi:ankyrin repeat domain-containing protein [Endozoicomonas elysicola]|uniref:Uncharacterized protein n=1 Tax=Endozoicomonas elysicola TaxID=305900 RepID=A0A081KAV8_9GAMM|nr:ankyrin repeat domain-containing protein [Endozoicomonas elysicola]KEI71284.1 hypothetical protein GV64_11520 [Endozoicomonas elysicola]